MKLNQVLEREVEEISLCNEEKNKINALVKEILKLLEERGLNAKIGGSLAKGTMIKKDTQDIDLFLVSKEEEIDKIDEKIKDLNAIKIHGSRDYFQIKKENITVELIPVLETKKAEDAKNVTDLSLMHVNYIVSKIKKDKKLANEIKLAKAFCYANDCYGAESYIKGFSGYALELLVVYFKSFTNFIKKIDKQRIIDPEKKYKNKKEVMQELNESKLISPVILIDPTNKKRNACASLSEDTFNKFLKSAKDFIKNPSKNSFEKKIMNVEKIQNQAKKQKAKIIQIRLYTDRQEGDIAATKMKKFFEFIINNIKKEDQKILFSSFSYDNGQEAFGFISIKENKKVIQKGPPIKIKEASKKFKISHKKTFVKGEYLYTIKNTSLEEIFNNLKKFEDEMGVRFEIQINQKT